AATADALGGNKPMSLAAPGAPAAEPAPAPPMEARVQAMERAEKKADGSPPAPQAPAIAIRTHFNPLAAFAPAVHTDATGRATVELTLPDNLTRYRVVAIAVAGERQFGKGENA